MPQTLKYVVMLPVAAKVVKNIWHILLHRTDSTRCFYTRIHQTHVRATASKYKNQQNFEHESYKEVTLD